MVIKDGFYAKVPADTAIILPHGYCIAAINPGKDSVHGVRILSLGSEANIKSSLVHLSHITSSFYKYKEGTHGHIEQFMEAVLTNEE